MHGGLEKWGSGSANCPTPAELDAFAEKVGGRPLSIAVDSNSVNVPQRKQVRRTTAYSTGHRQPPNPAPVRLGGSLLAVLPGPARQLLSSCNRYLHRAAMNRYAAHKEVPFQLTEAAPSRQSHGLLPAQQRLAHNPQQHHGVAPPDVAHMHMLKHQTPPAPHSLLGAAPPHLCRMSEASLQLHGQRLAGSQILPQALGAVSSGLHPAHPQAPGTVPCGFQSQTPGAMSGGLQQAPPGAYGPRKLPDSDAPPNVTVSTSTIPLSMAASLQHRGGDLSSIVHQINQLCQARAGVGTTSVCEGQIANPSPISRNLLINASSRVSAPGLGSGASCPAAGPPDKPPALPPAAAIQSQLCPSVANGVAAFPANAVHVRQQRVWTQHQLSHLQLPPEGLPPCKNPRSDPPAECTFPARTFSYLCKLAQADPPGPLSPVPPPGAYADRNYVHPPWGRTEVLEGFQAGRVIGGKYRPGKESLPGRSETVYDVDFLGPRDFVMGGFREPDVDSMERSAAGPPQDTGRALHPAY
ncbi:protein FAM222B-like [Phyllopteryx taeniolatus]|uniref:protein FAM222B-like n=1 Tax=Phyllopteryx taeniolatus TaxID=161469 RepID=UPI002AD26012|nr:protein FAM222B-like [Phyllopteryx taeniolatus]